MTPSLQGKKVDKVLYQKDGRIGRITLNRPEVMNFKARADAGGWKQAVLERDEGTYDWTKDRPIQPK